MQNNQQRLIYLICSLLLAWQADMPPAAAQITREQRMQLSDIVNKGNYFMARGQFQAAIDQYGQCFMIEPGNQVAKDNIVLCHNNWGIALFRQRKYDEAQAQWGEALKLNPYDRNAKNNLHVLKVTLDRLGAQSGGEKNDEGSNKASPKKATAKPPALDKTDSAPVDAPSGAVILTPGVKQSQTGETAGAPPATSSSDEFAGTSIKILPSASSQSAVNPPPTPPQTGTPAPSSPPTPTPAPAPQPVPVTPAPTTTQPITNFGPSTIEDQLAGVEMKVYGRKQENMPVFQRLEKLEVDTSGSVKQGTVQERIQVLRHSYGL